MSTQTGKEDFLFELSSEEIPASYQASLIGQWQKFLSTALSEKMLSYDELEVGGTPRRLFVYIQGLALVQREETVELKGPPRNICFDKDDKATPALAGFAAKAGIPADKVEFREMGKMEYAFASITQGGEKAEDVLGGILNQIILSGKTPRNMHWADHEIQYARPLLAYYAMLGEKSICFSELDTLEGLNCSHEVKGHFILHPEKLEIKSPKDYFSLLSSEGIFVRQAERKEKIKQMLEAEASAQNLSALIDSDLLEEVTFLVEKPGVVTGKFDESYLEMPEAVAISEMEEHQRYFPMRDKSGKLSNHFLIISNGDLSTSETKDNVRNGNERVLRARLEDGAFFYREDRKSSLADKVDALSSIVYMEGLGTMREKTDRLVKLSGEILSLAGVKLEESELGRAALLCKADLTTQLVYEFDHLQGEIGAEYAGRDGESETVSRAIYEHYLPRFQGDSLPDTQAGALLSLADKIDNIVAGFLAGKGPTSSQDPFALRRQTLYAIEILVKFQLSFSFKKLLENALKTFLAEHRAIFSGSDSDLVEQIQEFVLSRVVTIFEKQSIDKKLIRAGLSGADDNIYGIYEKLSALEEMRARDAKNFDTMLAGFRRMDNILEDYAAKGNTVPQNFTRSLLESDAEKKLADFSDEMQSTVNSASGRELYVKVFSLLAAQKEVIDQFFDTVMVMHDDVKIRDNRLGLLAAATGSVKTILNLSELQ